MIVNSRTPSLRFGTGHIFNSFFDVNDGINSRQGAQVLVENNVFYNSTLPLYSVDGLGFAVARGNEFGIGNDSAPTGTLAKMPYTYELLDTDKVKDAVVAKAGQTLEF